MTRIHRRFFLQQSAAVGTALLVKPVHAESVNEKLNIGMIGCGGRSKELLPRFAKLANVRIAALCDADEARLNEVAAEYPGADKYVDLRKLLEDKNVDAVAIATCNHWHALAAIWAMQRGKDVYVEKPLSHSHWEGQQVVNAARKLDRIVQLGTQQRSDPMQAEIKEYLHDKKALGEIKYVQVCRFGPREPIGKRATPLQPPKSVNYDLWLGPAQDLPIYREKFHYDWHWDWNTGNGELGNWGVHVLDDAINVALRDQCGIPKRMAAAGGRVLWEDAGDTPNVYFAYYDTGSVPVLFGLSNLTDGPNSRGGLKLENVGSGYIVHCENGYYTGQRGSGAAFDLKGKRIRPAFKGDAGAAHQQNFVDAVFAHDRSKLAAEIEIGHESTAWCNLAVASQRAGSDYTRDEAMAVREGYKPWGELVELIEMHLAKNGVDPKKSKFELGPTVEFDTAKQQFVGAGAEKANKYLTREYRKGFEVPDIA
jgi:predicted dehydrogenase